MMIALLLACGPDVRSQYEEQRKLALTLAADVPADWQPDLVVGVGEAALRKVVRAWMDSTLDDKVEPLRVELPLGATALVTPHLKITQLDTSPGKGCDSCIHFDAELDGEVSWALAGLGGTFPGHMRAAGQLQVVVEERTHIYLKPFKIGKIELTSKDLGGLRVSPESELQGYVRHALGDNLPPIPLGDLGAAGLPVRLVRVRTGDAALRLEALTDVPGASAATVPDPAADAVLLGISETAVAGLLRREAFTRGPVALDVAVDPRAIDVAGDQFTLDLRLWRLVGSGWWRDYRAEGRLDLSNGKLRLRPAGVAEVAASPGAELVDPLAALAQSAIFDAIADNLAQTLPAAEATKLGGVKVRAVATGVRGANDTLLLDAELRLPGKDR